jgi:hypothetical protein
VRRGGAKHTVTLLWHRQGGDHDHRRDSHCRGRTPHRAGPVAEGDRAGDTVVGLAASGEEAITQAAGLQPNMVLMNIGLHRPIDRTVRWGHPHIVCSFLDTGPVASLWGVLRVARRKRSARV